MKKRFHLAIPSHNLELAKKFYEKLGVKIGRENTDNVILDFFGDQVVCHLSPADKIENPKMYPRHFGMVFEEKETLMNIYELAKENLSDAFYKDLFTRYQAGPSEHMSFFLQDPSGNLIEFKYYTHESAIFS